MANSGTAQSGLRDIVAAASSVCTVDGNKGVLRYRGIKIEELAEHGYKLNASQLYPRFHRLERDGHLNREDQVVDGKLRKYYSLTPAGQGYLDEQKRRLLELIGEVLTAVELSQALDCSRRREAAKQQTA